MHLLAKGLINHGACVSQLILSSIHVSKNGVLLASDSGTLSNAENSSTQANHRSFRIVTSASWPKKLSKKRACLR